MKAGRLAAIAIAAALLVPATAGAKTVIYGGTIAGGGDMALTVVASKKGKPKGIVEIRAAHVPVVCEQSGPQTANTTIPVAIKVKRNSKFSFENIDEFGNRRFIDGKFSGRKAKNLSGDLQYGNHFPAEGTLPEEDCTTDVVTYSLKKGAPDVVVPQRAKPRGI